MLVCNQIYILLITGGGSLSRVALHACLCCLRQHAQVMPGWLLVRVAPLHHGIASWQAHAWVALGKACLVDEALAKRCVPLFVQELGRAAAPAVRSPADTVTELGESHEGFVPFLCRSWVVRPCARTGTHGAHWVVSAV